MAPRGPRLDSSLADREFARNAKSGAKSLLATGSCPASICRAGPPGPPGLPGCLGRPERRLREPGRERLWRERTAEIVALADVAVESSERQVDVLRLDALGGDLQAHVARQIDRGTDHGDVWGAIEVILEIGSSFR